MASGHVPVWNPAPLCLLFWPTYKSTPPPHPSTLFFLFFVFPFWTFLLIQSKVVMDSQQWEQTVCHCLTWIFARSRRQAGGWQAILGCISSELAQKKKKTSTVTKCQTDSTCCRAYLNWRGKLNAIVRLQVYELCHIVFSLSSAAGFGLKTRTHICCTGTRYLFSYL